MPVLAAISLMASAGEETPRTMTMMGGPIDARRSPTAVNNLATNKSLFLGTANPSNLLTSASGPSRTKKTTSAVTAFVTTAPAFTAATSGKAPRNCAAVGGASRKKSW